MSRPLHVGSVFLSLALATSLGACSSPNSALAPPLESMGESGAPFPVRGGLLRTFRERVTADAWARFERLRAAPDVPSRDRALEMLLFSMTRQELFTAGVTEVEQGERLDWAVAWSRDGGAGFEAVAAALDAAEIPFGGSMNRGSCGWYVQRSDFVRARRVLSRVPGLSDLDVQVVDPALGPR